MYLFVFHTYRLSYVNKLIKDLQILFCNRNPTPEASELIPFTWVPVTSNLRPYLSIGKKVRMETEERFLKERMAFWDLFYSIYGKNNIFSCKI